MTYRFIYAESYNKKARKFLKKHPDLIGQYAKCLKLLELDPYHRSLRMHSLKGRLKGLQSVSINMLYRITLELIIKKDEIILVDVGHHSEIY